MKWIWLLLLGCCCWGEGVAQNLEDLVVELALKYNLDQLDSIYKEREEKQNYTEALPYALAMRNIGEKELDIQDTAYATILFRIGKIYEEERDLNNALIYYQKAVNIQEKKAAIPLDYARSLSGLGIIFYYKGNYEKAEEKWIQTTNICKKLYGEQHLQYATSLNNLGVLYFSMGNYKKALSFYHEAQMFVEKY